MTRDWRGTPLRCWRSCMRWCCCSWLTVAPRAAVGNTQCSFHHHTDHKIALKSMGMELFNHTNTQPQDGTSLWGWNCLITSTLTTKTALKSKGKEPFKHTNTQTIKIALLVLLGSTVQSQSTLNHQDGTQVYGKELFNHTNVSHQAKGRNCSITPTQTTKIAYWAKRGKTGQIRVTNSQPSRRYSSLRRRNSFTTPTLRPSWLHLRGSTVQLHSYLNHQDCTTLMQVFQQNFHCSD